MALALEINNESTNNVFKKCGEITTRGENEFFLVCTLCSEVFLKLDDFIAHIGQQHLSDMYEEIKTIKKEFDKDIEDFTYASKIEETNTNADLIFDIKEEQPMVFEVEELVASETEEDYKEMNDPFMESCTQMEQSEIQRDSDESNDSEATKHDDLLKYKNDMTIAIIAEYKNYPLLWDIKHPFNQNRAARKDAFQKIVGAVNENFNSDLEWKTLRMQIGKMLTKYSGEIQNQKIAEIKDKPFVPSWRAEQLKFLDSVMKYRQHKYRLKDDCAICKMDMRKQPTVRLLPCRHLFHVKCSDLIKEGKKCPICGGDVKDNVVVGKTVYNKYNNEDRVRIIEAANRGEDWYSLAASLGVVYKTAYTWIQSGRVAPLKKKEGGNPKKLSENEIAEIIRWLEDDSTITLKQLVSNVTVEFRKHISISTVENYLDGKIFTKKSAHQQTNTMNSHVNKRKRAKFVAALLAHIQSGRQIVYIGETNFNLFCRRPRSHARLETPATLALPSSRGPSIHLFAVLSSAGVFVVETHRASLKKEGAAEWMKGILEKWASLGNELGDLIIVCDNAPCHSDLESVIPNNGSTTLLRLESYSPMLNPLENLFAKIKSYIKTNIALCEPSEASAINSRLQYLETLIHQAKDTISSEDCARAIQNATSFYANALALRDMPIEF